MPIVPLGEWTPDLPPLVGGAVMAQNVSVQDTASYSPEYSFERLSNALTSTCQGAIFGQDASGNTIGFAGDNTKLYTYTVSSQPNWVDASRLLDVPVQAALATATIGGTLADGTYYYVVTALNAAGETLVSNEHTINTTGGGTSTVTVTWAAITYATSYRVYRGTVAGAEDHYFAVAGGATITFIDTGGAGTAGTPPIVNTAEVPYNTANDQHWTWVFYGLNLIAAQPNDAIQSFMLGTSTNFADLAAAAPKAKYIARVRDNFLMVANTTDTVSGTVPWRVWWPAVGDPTMWPTPGTTAAAQVQSDYRDLVGNGGANQGLVGGLANADVAVFQRFGVWRGMYVGPPVIFSFSAIEQARGCISPTSIVQVGPVCFYLSDDGFYMFDGVSSTPIGRNKIDNFFWGDVDRNYLYHVQGVADPKKKLIYWCYPGPGNIGGNPNRYVIFNYAFNRWSYRNDGASIEVLIERTITLGYTMEGLDAVGTMDTLPAPLDDAVWQGNSLVLGAFDTTHSMGFYTGATLAATIDTSEAQLNDNGLAKVSRVTPIIDTALAQVALGTRFRQADAVAFTSLVSMTATTGTCPIDKGGTGAFHRARIQTTAGDVWVHAQGVNFTARPAGRR